MTELIVLYRIPNDPGRFDKYYREVHGPMTSKLPGLKGYKYGLRVRWTAASANSSGTGAAHSTALRLPSMPLPRRKARPGLPTCQTTIMMFRSSWSSKSRRILSVDIAGFLQFLAERGNERRISL